MDVAEVVDGLGRLVPLLREQATEAERLRVLPDKTVALLKESHLIRLLQPVRYGGYEANPGVFYDAAMRVASGCGSAGWITAVVGVHPWQLGLFDDRLQAEIWGEDPDTWVGSSYMPTGEVTVADGGFRVSGRWNYSSGSAHCQWTILGGMVRDDAGEIVEMINFVVPRSDYRIDDVWHVMGLKGTGSNDIVLDDVFVPSYRTIRQEQLATCECPGQAVNPGPLYRMPFGSMFASTITAGIVGMAEGLIEAHVDHQRARSNPVRDSYVADPFTLHRIGWARAEVDAARASVINNLEDQYRFAVDGQPIPMDLRVKTRRDQVVGTRRAVRAADELFENSGGRALRDESPLQRLFRDIHAGRNHFINTPEGAIASDGSNAVGAGPTDFMI